MPESFKAFLPAASAVLPLSSSKRSTASGDRVTSTGLNLGFDDALVPLGRHIAVQGSARLGGEDYIRSSGVQVGSESNSFKAFCLFLFSSILR